MPAGCTGRVGKRRGLARRKGLWWAEQLSSMDPLKGRVCGLFSFQL
jgi:hypothetical protein